MRSRSSRCFLSESCERSNLAFTWSLAFLPASHSLSARCMSTTAMRISSSTRTGTPSHAPAASASAVMHAAPLHCVIRLLRLPLVLERSAEGEEHEARLVLRLGVECLAELDPQRPDRREPADAGARREAGVVERERLPVRKAVGVAGVDEDDAFQPDALHDREDDLVVEDDLRAAAHGRIGDHVAEDVLAILARAEGPGLEAPDAVDAAGEVALEQRELVAFEARVAPSIAALRPQRVREIP